MTMQQENAAAPGWAPLPPEYDQAAVRLLADCPPLGSPAAAGAALAAMRADPAAEILGWVAGEELIALYALRQGKLHYELPWLAVAPQRRGQRFGRSALTDALRRAGRKPLTVEADEELKGWFQRLGFRVVGRRPLPGGGVRYRLGWYAPRRPGEAGHGAHG